jgi:DNA polymerase III subunit delta
VKLPAPWQDREWADLVRDELKRFGRDAERAAVAAILERAGTDATAIAMRCGQLVAASKGRVTVADVERIVEGQGNRGGFAIADAIADRDPAAAVTAVRGALEAGEAPLALLGAITFRIRQLLQVRGGATAKQMGTSPAMHSRLGDRARRFAPGELAWCHDRIARTDLDLKGSDLPPELILEVAVLELAVSREVGPPWNPLVRASGQEP